MSFLEYFSARSSYGNSYTMFSALQTFICMFSFNPQTPAWKGGETKGIVCVVQGAQRNAQDYTGPMGYSCFLNSASIDQELLSIVSGFPSQVYIVGAIKP